MERRLQIKEVYDLIENSRSRYGKLKKCEIHFHTPASYDYRLKTGLEYKNLNITDVIEIAVEYEYLTLEAADSLKGNISDYLTDSYVNDLKQNGKPFDSFKEYLSYMLVAHQMYIHNIEVAIVTDHNTIIGFKKLKYALDEYYRARVKNIENKEAIYLFLGVEISCSEKNHLIGIFDESRYEMVQDFLDEIIINDQDGTYYTSHFLIGKIAGELDGIAYLAHLNSSDLIGSLGYNKTLFSMKEMIVAGLTNISAQQSVRQRLWNFNKDTSKNISFLYESDSHELDTIGCQNSWIKFNEINYPSLKKAFVNFNISVYTEKPQLSDKFIKGVIVEAGNKGFLKAKTSNRFILEFSKDLNCIIGGRGTGKSTILNVLETALTLEYDNHDSLKFVCNHQMIYILFQYLGVDYIVQFLPQVEAHYNHLKFLEKAFDDKEGHKLSNHWVNVYKLTDDGFFIQIPKKDIKDLLSKIYRRGYSINSILTKIDQGQISDFVKDTIFYGMKYTAITNFLNNLKRKHNRYKISFLRANLRRMIGEIENRRLLVEQKIKGFNSVYGETIKIVYSPKEMLTDFFLDRLLKPLSNKQHILNTYLTWHDVERYVHSICTKMDYIIFLEKLLKRKYEELESVVKLTDMINHNEISILEIDKTLTGITKDNLVDVYDSISDGITLYLDRLVTSIEKWFEVVDEFTLEFNVNSREFVEKSKPIMRNITDLSLGQKVVAVLSFVFKFGYHVNDNTPLIIDQPEDNLDNQYIYKNLVSSLREIKNSRQVIVVTHSSTIVTNADAEQVIVMGSDNEKGWVEKNGYPSDPIIIKHILNYLEGGSDSFKHKMSTYTIMLPT